MEFENTPKTLYFAVIFTSILSENIENYQVIAQRMLELVQKQPGFLGVESAREEIGITVSYWQSLEAILNWKSNFEHQEAQYLGKKHFYQSYQVRICKVEQAYSYQRN